MLSWHGVLRQDLVFAHWRENATNHILGVRQFHIVPTVIKQKDLQAGTVRVVDRRVQALQC